MPDSTNRRRTNNPTMNRVPTLLVGLGGIGCRIVDAVNKMLSGEDRQYVGCIGMDTNLDDLKKLDIKYVQTSDGRLVKDYLQVHPEYKQWFPVNRFTVGRGMLTGAGQIRAISRMAALAAQEDGRFLAIDEEIRRIRRHDAGHDNSSFYVFFCGSITGGTGAGIFLQMPYYVKKVLRDESGMTNVRTRGMFISADITKNVQPSKINRDAVMVNAYACMKELNAFFLTQQMSDEENHLRLEYYERTNIRERKKVVKAALHAGGISEYDYDEDGFDEEMENADIEAIASDSANIPYDSFYLIEGTDEAGSIGSASMPSIEKHVANILHTMLFTPVKTVAAGVEDNYVLQDMETGGMGRYSSAGLCTLRYPYEQMKEYATLRWVKDLVQSEWLLLDTKFEQEVRDARDRQKSDPSARIPEMKKAYVRLFEQETSGGKGTRLGALKQEAFIENEEVSLSAVNKADSYIGKIEAAVEEKLETEAISSRIEQCRINMRNAADIKVAEREFQRIYDELRLLEKYVSTEIDSNRSSVANDAFPVGEESLWLTKDGELSVYRFLAGVHPVAARYLCYCVINRLDAEIRDLRAQVEDVDLHDYMDRDYYGSREDGVQTADEAVAMIRQQAFSLLKSKKKSLQKVVRTFSQMVSYQTSLLIDYGKNSIKLSNYLLLRERFEILADYYERFFKNLRESIKVNDERVSILEKSFVEPSFGEIDVYAGPEAFRAAYSELSGSLQYVLPEDTKRAVFTGIYRIAAGVIRDSDTRMSEKQKRTRDDLNARRLKEIFDNDVIKTMETIVADKGRGVIDLNIKQAIGKEVEMESGLRPDNDPEKFEEARVAHEIQLIEGALKEASPMMAVSSSRPVTENVYVTMHTDVAELKAGVPDRGATEDILVLDEKATDNQKACFLINSEFSRYEIICMKAVHKYEIQELVKYTSQSEFARAYRERIAQVGRRPSVEGVDAWKTVVNPHLNRYWQEEGFVPELAPADDRKFRNDVQMAFVYAMGLDCFVRWTDEENGRILWMFLANAGLTPEVVRKAGRLTGNGYADLLDSLYYNRRIKNRILKLADTKKREIKGHADADDMASAVVDTWFIDDLAQSALRDEEDDENILDIFMGMYPNMDHDRDNPANRWDGLFAGLDSCLRDYLDYMLNGNAALVRKAYPEIIDKLYRYSHIDAAAEKAEAEGKDTPEAVRRIRIHMDNLKNQIRNYF